MKFQTAAIVGVSAFLLSFVAALLGGVPFFEMLVRAVFWGVFGFGAAVGAEALLRNLVPDLFLPVGGTAADTKEAERTVDITVDDDPPPFRSGFVEEVDENEIVPAQRTAGQEVASRPQSAAAAAPASEPSAEAAEEEMPEIGSFLDSFKPNLPDEGEEQAAPAPEYGDYAPAESDRRSSQDSPFDAEAQDPVILAKAVQTFMKRDAQGN